MDEPGSILAFDAEYLCRLTLSLRVFEPACIHGHTTHASISATASGTWIRARISGLPLGIQLLGCGAVIAVVPVLVYLCAALSLCIDLRVRA